MTEENDLEKHINYNIHFLKMKISNMERVVPNHRNISWFKGQLFSYEKMLEHIKSTKP